MGNVSLEIKLLKQTEFSKEEISKLLSQETKDSLGLLGEIEKGFKQVYSGGITVCYITINPNGNHPGLKGEINHQLPYSI